MKNLRLSSRSESIKDNRMRRLQLFIFVLFLSASASQHSLVRAQEPPVNPPPSIIDISDEEAEDETQTPQRPVLTDDEKAQLREVFDRLGAAEFQVREQATTELIQFGDKAIEPLKQWQSESTNPEVLARLKLIIDHIENSGLPKRIAVFMSAPADVKKHGFYGWPSFSKVAGSNRVARRIFTQMLERHSRICNEDLSLEQMDALQIEIVKSLWDLRRTTGETSIADAVVLQYLMIRLGKKSSEELERLTSDLVRFAPYARELNFQEDNSTLKRITGQWMGTVQRDTAGAMVVSLNYRIKEGLLIARNVLKNGMPDEMNFNVAMQVLLVFGDVEDLQIVESYFENDRVVFRENDFADGVMVEVQQQFRDLALAVAVHLRGLTMTDYFPTVQPHHLRRYNPMTLKFLGSDTEQLRREAFEKYKAATNSTQ